MATEVELVVADAAAVVDALESVEFEPEELELASDQRAGPGIS